MIKRGAVADAEKMLIDKANWGYDKYKSEAYLQISYDDSGFNVKFTVGESNPLREKKNHFEHVHLDSCVELFVKFTPEKSDRYINFETNANGAMNVAWRTDRYNSQNLKPEEVEGFDIKTEIFEDYWTVSYKIGFDFIKSYYPEFDINKCEYLLGNIYKCGENTEIEHYMSYFKVDCPNPDFHRPEYFGKIFIEKNL